MISFGIGRRSLFVLTGPVVLVLCFLGPRPVQAQRLPQSVVPEHYTLALTPDLTTATFTGSEKIDVMVEQPVDAITLNAAEIKLDSVSAMVEGKKLKATVTLDAEKEQATFSFDKQIVTGRVTLLIEYSGILNNELRGFYLSKTAKRNYAVTQFEATDARRAFPSFDEPALKATFDVALVVKKGDTAISNTEIVSDEPGPLVDEHTIRFATTPKMSTYLLAFLVGDFKCVSGASDGVPIRACATPGNEQMGRYAVTSAEFFLHYYDEYFGIKYPMPKLDMIALPDFEAGAMENFGAITYRETDLLIDERTASLDQKERVAVVVAHEMAHQWFGDMVTMQWWNNVWLNEGFATWMENKAVEQWKPEWQFKASVANDLQTTLNLDARARTRTIRAEADTPEQINQMFDGIAYGKAGAVLGMVEHYVGEETFRRGVHNYLAAHLYANATAEDFWNAQTAASHKPVDQIMGSLVTEPGVPLLSFAEPQDGKAAVSQQRFFLNARQKNHTESDQSWTLPVCLLDEAECSVVSAAHPSVPAQGNELPFANAAGVGYYRSSYPENIYAKIEQMVESRLTPSERISLLGDEQALMHAGKVPVSDYLELAAAVRDDKNYFVMKTAVDGVGTVKRTIAGSDEEQAALAQWVRHTFGPALERLGDSVAGEDPEKGELRVTLFSALGETGRDPVVIARARQIAVRYLNDPASEDSTMAPAALLIAAANGDAALFDLLQRTYETSSIPQIRSSALNALGRFPDPALERRALDYAVSGKVRNQDSGAMVGRILSNRETRDVAWQYMQANWDKVATQVTKWGGSRVVGGASGFCSVEGRDQVESFFAAHKVPGTDRSLNSAIDQIDDCIALRAAQEAGLRTWLRMQQAGE